MVVSSLPPIGCLRIQITAKSLVLRTCSHKENVDAQSCNDKIEKLLARMEAQLYGSRIDTYNPLMDMITNPQKYDNPYCRICGNKKKMLWAGLLEAGPLCDPSTPICANATHNLFWDNIHPGESTCRIISRELVKLYLPKLSEFDKLKKNLATLTIY